MKSNYFNVEVKPTMPVAQQDDGDYVAGNLLFDWTSFQIPRGPAKLIGVTALVRGEDGADHPADMELIYAKTKDSGNTVPPTLGTTHAAISTGGWQNHLIGASYLDIDAAGSDDTDLVTMSILHAAEDGDGLVLEAEPNSGDTVGLDTLYVAGIARGAMNFSTTVLSRGGTTADGSVAVAATDKGGDDDPDADLIFAPGDVIHGSTNGLVGTIKSIAAFATNNQAITFTSAIANTLADNDELYNISPITLILHFEK